MQEKKISNILSLHKYMNQDYNEAFYQYFQNLAIQFPYYRAIKRDGNSFYRAFAFCYLSNHTLDTYESTFPKIQWKCKIKNSHITSTKIFQEQLAKVWKKYLRKLRNTKTKIERELKIQMLFNQIQYFDEILIGYFRSVNYQYLKQHQSNFSRYSNQLPLKNYIQQYEIFLNNVSTFNQEAMEVQVSSLSEAMHMKTIVQNIEQLKRHQFMKLVPQKPILLFQINNHYNILYRSQDQTQNVVKDETNLQQQTKQQGIRLMKKSKKNMNYSSQDFKKSQLGFDLKYKIPPNIFRQKKDQKQIQKVQKEEQNILKTQRKTMSLLTWSQAIQRVGVQFLGLLLIIFFGYLYINKL